MVYLIDLGTCYKIGMTFNLKNRVKQFKTSRETVIPIDVIIYPYPVLDLEEIDNKMESDLHRMCQDYKIQGELFQKTPEILHIFKRYKFDIGDNYNWEEDIKNLLDNSKTNKLKSNDNRKNNGNRKKTIYQNELKGNFIKKHESTKTLKEEGYNTKGILCVLRNEQHKSQGYIWSQKELNEEELNERIKLAKKRTDSTSDFILQYTLNNEFLAKYKSMTEASKRTGIPISSISLCCQGRYKTAGKFIWKREAEL